MQQNIDNKGFNFIIENWCSLAALANHFEMWQYYILYDIELAIIKGIRILTDPNPIPKQTLTSPKGDKDINWS